MVANIICGVLNHKVVITFSVTQLYIFNLNSKHPCMLSWQLFAQHCDGSFSHFQLYKSECKMKIAFLNV